MAFGSWKPSTRQTLFPTGTGAQGIVGVCVASGVRAEEILGNNRDAYGKSHGTIVERTWTIAGDVIRVRDLEGRLFLEKLGPNDDPEYVARRLLRQKSGQSTFHAPIKYRPSYH
jgi:hypothetical protein